MIFATDLDRTLLPDGKEEYDGSIPLLFRRLEDFKHTLVYVSGRNTDLLNEAVSKYGIKLPDYFIGEAGTVIYVNEKGVMVPDKSWILHLKEENPNWDRRVLVQKIGMESVLTLQEGWKQNPYKISYYLKDYSLEDEVLGKINSVLAENKINSKASWSVDPLQEVGLIDIIPDSATKLAALEFVREKLGENKDGVIYCGDSGNDVLPLAAGYKAILVKNAPEDVKDEIMKEMKKKGLDNKLYIAKGGGKLNGNYSSGIIEGLVHFGIIEQE